MSAIPSLVMRGGLALCVATLASACATTAATTQSATEPARVEAVVVQPVLADRIVAEPVAAARLAESGPPARIAVEPEDAETAAGSSPGAGSAEPAAAANLGDRVAEVGAMTAGIVGGLAMASKLDMLGAQYLAGALVAYAIYDPLAPTWRIDVSRAGGERIRMDLRMKSLITGGEGEARQVFLRSARRMVEAGGFAGYDVIRYEEGMESSRPFARRVASGEIRLVRSRQFPEL